MSVILYPGENLLLYGKTGSGKTTQLVELIKRMATKEKPARIYLTDGGSAVAYKPLVAKGICQLEIYRDPLDRFIWIDNAVQGNVLREGKYVDGDPSNLSLIGFESLSGQGDLVLNALGQQAAAGQNVGGEPAPALKIMAEGKQITIPSGSRTHYLVAQRWLLEKVWQSFALPCPTVWTAHEDIATLDKKHPDGDKTLETSAGLGIRGIIGPMIAGSALTKELPKYFIFTFRLSTRVTEVAKKHIMFTGHHKDGQLEGLANSRTPLNSKVGLIIEPTDVAATLLQIQKELAAQ